MKLYLIRHAHYEEQDAITPRGREECAKNALILKRFHPEITAIYHSTKRRARESAEVFHEILCHHLPLIEKKGLTPSDDPTPLIHELNASDKNIMIVSHLPFLEHLCSHLLYGDSRTLPFTFETSSIISLEKNKKGWRLIGIISNQCFEMQKAL